MSSDDDLLALLLDFLLDLGFDSSSVLRVCLRGSDNECDRVVDTMNKLLVRFRLSPKKTTSKFTIILLYSNFLRQTFKDK